MKKLLLFAVFLILPYCSNAQLFVNNVTQTPAQLVQNVLLGQGVVVSNITFNGSAANANVVRDQVGYFTTGITPTNLGIPEGIVMGPGKVDYAVGPNNSNGGFPATPTDNPIEGDPDLALIAPLPIKNKAILEFDFVPTGNQLSFNFVFASEEYPEFVNTQWNDVFGFFLRGPGIAGPYSGGAANIALIPSTIVPIAINSVNGGFANGCPAVLPGGANSAYYVNNCGGATIQYDGFTTVLSASATVQCGQLYHIKLAIANVSDNAYESAVFLQANSFNVNPIDLGSDYLVGGDSALCAGETLLLDTGLGNAVPHQWYLDTVAIPGATGSTYLVTEPGVFSVVAFPFGAGCPIEDAITVEYFEDETDSPIDLTECVNLFDLTENTATILGTLDPNDYEIAYFLNQTDAENFANEISNPTTFVSTSNPQTIYAGISGFVTGCVIVKEFEISVISCTLDPQPNPLSSCDDNPVDGFTLFDLTQSDTAALNGLDATLYTVTYHNSQADANIGNAPITPANAYNGFNGEIIYVRVEENAAPTTFGTTSFALTINPTPSIADVVQTICSGDT
ncbi:MAG TPA: choice-of-anchor L domain-containing protein, partial [Flavobacterium sp.]|nr:choice-of-anchor L domain-containing protein [Flavobacterium sp.]